MENTAALLLALLLLGLLPGSYGPRSANAQDLVNWRESPATVELKRGVGVTLEFGDATSDAADLKLTGTELVSETGEIALVPGQGTDALAALVSVPKDGYRRGVKIDDLLGKVGVLRLPGGRYAKFRMGSFEEGGTPTALEYRAVSIRYALSEPGAQVGGRAKRSAEVPGSPSAGSEVVGRAETGGVSAFDSRLAGRWKLRIPAGVGYRTDGYNVYQRIDPGAGMGVLTLSPAGSYVWSGIYWNKPRTSVRGRAVRVRPSFASSGTTTYWKVNDGRDDYLILWNSDNRLPFTMVYPDGGFIAGGEMVR